MEVEGDHATCLDHIHAEAEETYAESEKLSPRTNLNTLVEWDKDCLPRTDDSKDQVLYLVDSPDGE